MEKLSQPSAKILSSVRDDINDALLDFDSIFDRFAPYVASVALRLLGDESCVDDVVQDVFLDCFRKFDSLCNLEHARRWLVKVTVRKASKRLRKKKVAQFFTLSDPRCPEPSIPLVTADERAELVMLYCLLERLPVKLRLAWSLRYLEGAEISEVAYACGCSPATAKRRIREVQQVIMGDDDE